MNIFSLRSIIDDILLIIRNNNISESEDFSRLQIASWILAYKSQILKQKIDKTEQQGNDDWDEGSKKVIGPLKLEDVESLDCTCLYTKRTVKDIPNLIGGNQSSILSVFDQEGCVIQRMEEQRRHYHFFRKYTFGEMTYWYKNGRIYLKGLTDLNKLKYIWVEGLFEDSEDEDEDEVLIPGWMVPTIKKLIMDNELSFMLRLPSDDDNNSTLSGIKPGGLQQDEK